MICNKNIYIVDKLKKPFSLGTESLLKVSSETKNMPKIYGTKPTDFGWIGAILWLVYIS